MEFEDIKKTWDTQQDSFALDITKDSAMIKARYQSMCRSERSIAVIFGLISLLAFTWVGFMGYLLATVGVSKMKEMDLIPPSFMLLMPLYVGILSLYPVVNYIQQVMNSRDFEKSLRGHVFASLVQLRNRLFLLRSVPIAYIGIYAIFIIAVLLSPDINVYKEMPSTLLSIVVVVDLCFFAALCVCFYLLSKRRYAPRLKNLQSILDNLDTEMS